MRNITRQRLLLTMALIVGALLAFNYFQDDDVQSTHETSLEESQNEESDAVSQKPNMPATQSQVANHAQALEQQLMASPRPDTLNPAQQKFAYECFNGWYFNNAKEDVKSMTTMLKGFFKHNQVFRNVAEKEVSFIDNDGVSRKLRAEPAGVDEDGKTKMTVKLIGASGSEEPLPYELQNLDWNDIATRMLSGKKKLQERTVMEVNNDDKSRHALVEYVNGERTNVRFEIAGKKLSCGQGASSSDVQCDCQKEEF